MRLFVSCLARFFFRGYCALLPVSDVSVEAAAGAGPAWCSDSVMAAGVPTPRSQGLRLPRTLPPRLCRTLDC